jgi:modulator of FtsH protease
MEYAAHLNRPGLSDSVRKTLSNIFTTVGAMVGITALTGFLSMGSRLGLGVHLSLFVASLVILFVLRKFQDSGFGLVLLAAFSAISGVTMGPLLTHYARLPNGPQLVATAAALTAIAAWGSAAYVMKTKKEFSRFGTLLFGALLVLLAVMLLNIFVQSTMLHLVVCGAGAILFLFILLFHIGDVVSGREQNYISASIGIYLSLLNLFQFILSLLGFSSPKSE